MFKNIPFDRVCWVTSSFLFGTLFLCLTAVPAYLIINVGMGWFTAGLFAFYMIATGLSITLGYHRLFSHISFKAKLPVRLFVAIFGAAAFENSALSWASDHRRHHKHVDHHDDDPYSISRGLWWAHMGWLLFKLDPEPPMDNVNDLRRSKLLLWQHRWVQLIALLVGLVLPTVLCGVYYGSWKGALEGFLIVGILRTVLVQHATFFINSACHYIGNQPYSTDHSARDSWIMALFTYGEGYHNYHHEFEYDYRNGVKAWQWDPTKWTIWLLSKVGLTSNLRTVSDAKILLAEMTEARRRLDIGLEQYREVEQSGTLSERYKALLEQLHHAQEDLGTRYYELQKVVVDRVELSRSKVEAWRKELRASLSNLERVARRLSRVRVPA